MRTIKIVVLACGVLAAAAEPVRAQLDPLLFVKRMPPNVIIVLDTSLRMMEDVEGYYYDPNFYTVADDPSVAAALSVPLGTATYRRKYLHLQWTGTQDISNRFMAEDIVAVPAVFDPSNPATANAPADLAYLNPTRLGIAKRGILQAVSENAGATYRWGLIKTRQSSPEWRLSPRCDKPVDLTSNATLQLLRDSAPCSAGSAGKFAIYDPSVAVPNYSLTSITAPVVQTAPNTAAAMTTLLNRGPFDVSALIPAGLGSSTYDDRPLAFQLVDAAQEASAVMARDAASTRACRNTIVVLITSGRNSGDAAYLASNDAAARASGFRNITGGGVTRRVPIYVIGLGVPAADEDELRAIATNSGGRYFNVTDQPSVTRIINLAVQAGFSRPGDFSTSSASEFTGVSPIVGTVNSKGMKNSTGTVVTNDEILRASDNTVIPQRSNVMITAGFTLPGMEGRIRAFRVYKPVADSTKAIGYRFDADGSKLWPDLGDGRPWLAGQARTPADPNARNIYTAVPDGSGGITVVSFDAGNAGILAPHLALPAEFGAANVISALRAMPIGAVIGSTPALMDPPSLDPPPDVDYGRPDGSDTFAGQHKNRRGIIFVGANDGMIHAIDARTGYEVWAFIPYNLLPKLKTIVDGQPIEQFDFFVDSSPKIAEVKTHVGASHEWRSLLIIGEGAGGTFYQAFDVTEAGMGVAPEQDDLSAVYAMLQRFDEPNESIQFLWSFPNYNSFDPTITATIPVSDSTPGGKVKVFGDLKPSATLAEKTVGFTWSDPAVGPLDVTRETNVVMVGSGYFPDIETSALLQRGAAAAPRAGRAFYLLKVEDGTLLGNPTGAACSGSGCLDVGDAATSGIKNALQADPSAAGDNGVPIVKKAYIGDLDGKYWRLDFNAAGTISKLETVDTRQPIFGSSALLFLGSVDVYMFFATGSDLLPSTSPYGAGTFKLYALKDRYPAAASVVFSPALAAVSNISGFANGERPTTAPSVAGDIVFFTTSTNNASDPCSDFTSNLYAFTYLGGAAYDTNRNGRLDSNESPRVTTVAGRASSPFIVDQHLYFGSAGAGGFNVEVFGDDKDFNNGVGQVGIRILSWREIR